MPSGCNGIQAKELHFQFDHAEHAINRPVHSYRHAGHQLFQDELQPLRFLGHQLRYGVLRLQWKAAA